MALPSKHLITDLPHSIDAEQAVIAGIVLDWKEYADVSMIVEAKMFYKPEHFTIWNAISQCLDNHEVVDEVLLLQQLHDDGDLEAVGNHLYIGECCSRIENNAYLIHYAKMVRDKYLHRCLRSLVGELDEKVLKSYSSFENLQSEVQSSISKILELGTKEKGTSLVEILQKIEEETERKIKGENEEIDEQALIKWGIEKLDNKFGSMNPQLQDFLVLVAGDSSHGKSAFVRQIFAENLLYRNKVGVAYLLETGREMWVKGIASRIGRVNLRQPYPETLNEKDGEVRIAKFKNCFAELKERADQNFFCYENLMSIEEIVTRTEQILAKTGVVDMIVVDYLQLVESKESRGKRGDEIIGNIVKKLKNLATKCNAVCFLISSLNNDFSPDKGPTRANVRGSGDIKFGADRLILVHRPPKNMDGQEQASHKHWHMVMTQDKSRNGVCGIKLMLTFTPSIQKFWDSEEIPHNKRGRPSKIGDKGKKVDDNIYKNKEGTVTIFNNG